MNGILVIDKPADWTSHDVVARARRLLRERRIGHTGTLDPFATGVLVLLVGHATRLAQLMSGAEKEYVAVIRFGYATTTGDLTGEEVQSPAGVQSPKSKVQSREEVQGSRFKVQSSDSEILSPKLQALSSKLKEAMQQLTGEIMQTPPMYSAKKVNGEKLYELARRGETIERAPVKVFIREFVALPFGSESEEISDEPPGLFRANDDGTFDLRVRVVCSAGTYIRVLAEDLGLTLGIGAHLRELRRTRAGNLDLTAAHTLEELENMAETESAPVTKSSKPARRSLARATAEKLLLPMDVGIRHLPALRLDTEQCRRVAHGMTLTPPAGNNFSMDKLNESTQIRLLRGTTDELLAVGVYQQDRIQPRIVFPPDDKATA